MLGGFLSFALILLTLQRLTLGFMSVVRDAVSQEQCANFLHMLEVNLSWDVSEDSIDGRSMDQIDILERGFVNDWVLYDMASEIEGNLSSAVKEYMNVELYLYWIFVRRYSTFEGHRDRLMPHRDSNELTLNILLDDNFNGGELYIVSPNSTLESEYDGNIIENQYEAGTTFLNFFETVDHRGD